VPRTVSTPQSQPQQQHLPQSYSHNQHHQQQSHYVPHQLYENHHQPYPEQMDQQIEQLISSTHVHIPHIHAHPLHAPNVRSPPVSTPQPPHPFSNHLSLESESAMFYYSESKDVPFTPSDPFAHPMSPHVLSQVYQSNISSTNKLAHNIRSTHASMSHVTPSSVHHHEEDETLVNSGNSGSGRKTSPHTTRTAGSNSARKSTTASSVQSTPASARKSSVGSSGNVGSATKRTPAQHDHTD